MDFYYIDPKFIDYLQKVETEKRGFTRVPNVRYDQSHYQKFIVGVVLNIGEYRYYAPVSHYNKKRPNNVLIEVPSDKIDKIKGSIRLNYMFPVLDKYIQKVQINNIQDLKHKRLLLKELHFCKSNESTIRNTALITYIDVLLGINTKLTENSCDFQLLEEALKNPPQFGTIGDSDKGLISTVK